MQVPGWQDGRECYIEYLTFLGLKKEENLTKDIMTDICSRVQVYPLDMISEAFGTSKLVSKMLSIKAEKQENCVID